MQDSFSFKILEKSKKSKARIGLLETPYGAVETPAFVAVATQATVKTLTPADLKEIGVQIILGNTYHLFLRPGEKIVAKMEGLHNFMQWQGPMMTDSGGFQAFSLGAGLENDVGKIGKIFPEESVLIQNSKFKIQNHKSKFKNNSGQGSLVKIREEGVEFRSHIDGSKHFFTPEKSIEIQKKLGADIIFAFDECTSPLAGYEYTKKATERTHRWAERCLNGFKIPAYRAGRPAYLAGGQNSKFKNKQVLFGIVQGGKYRDLREHSAKFISGLDFFGFGIGGSLGRSKKDMYKVLDWTIPILPEEKPRHLLGIGRPEDIKEAIRRGIDLFDCVWPTRIARHGAFIISEKKILKITNSEFKNQKNPIDEKCSCYCCRNFSRAYLHHLFSAGEILGQRLATLHNLKFMADLFKKIRSRIAESKL